MLYFSDGLAFSSPYFLIQSALTGIYYGDNYVEYYETVIVNMYLAGMDHHLF